MSASERPPAFFASAPSDAAARSSAPSAASAGPPRPGGVAVGTAPARGAPEQQPLTWLATADGARTVLSPGWLAFRGRTHDEERGLGWLAGVHPDERDAVSARWFDALRAGEPFRARYRLRRADGAFRWVVDTGAALPPGLALGLEGAPRLALAGVCHDDTDETRDALATKFLADVGGLLATRGDCRATLAAVARLAVPALADVCAIDLLDSDGYLRPAAFAHGDPRRERPAAELLARVRASVAHARGAEGFAGNEVDAPVLLRRVGDALEAPQHGGVDPAVLAALGVHSYAAVPVRAQTPDGPRTLGAVALAVLDAGRALDERDLATLEALAFRLGRALELAQRLRDVREEGRARSELLATVSHELRTPLSAIIGWAGLLRRGALDTDGVRRALEAIERSAREQTRLVEDLLDASQIAAGTLRLSLRRCALDAVVREALALVRPAAEARGVTLELAVGPGGYALAGDPARLRQAVAHVLTNGVKFTPAGGVVHVSLSREGGPEGEALWVRVRDTGRGIGPDVLPYIFERFRQGDGGATRAHGGLGLGLSLVRHLLELHGGAVSAQSEGEGRGALFALALPLPQPRDPEAAQGPAHARGYVELLPAEHAGAHELAGLSVLLVDASEETRSLLAAALSAAGARVRSAGDLEGALQAFRARPCDVVVAATPTPWPEGFATLRALRALGARYGGLVPAAALTDHVSPEEVSALCSAGYQVALTRPVDPRRLVRSVRELAGLVGGVSPGVARDDA